jgi:hypothetical protein
MRRVCEYTLIKKIYDWFKNIISIIDTDFFDEKIQITVKSLIFMSNEEITYEVVKLRNDIIAFILKIFDMYYQKERAFKGQKYKLIDIDIFTSSRPLSQQMVTDIKKEDVEQDVGSVTEDQVNQLKTLLIEMDSYKMNVINKLVNIIFNYVTSLSYMNYLEYLKYGCNTLPKGKACEADQDLQDELLTFQNIMIQIGKITDKILIKEKETLSTEQRAGTKPQICGFTTMFNVEQITKKTLLGSFKTEQKITQCSGWAIPDGEFKQITDMMKDRQNTYNKILSKIEKERTDCKHFGSSSLAKGFYSIGKSLKNGIYKGGRRTRRHIKQKKQRKQKMANKKTQKKRKIRTKKQRKQFH